MRLFKKRANFYEVCAKTTDFELCNAIAGAIESAYGNPAGDKTPEPERLVYLIWFGCGFAESGGLVPLLASNFENKSLADALDFFGLPEAADILREALAFRPDEPEILSSAKVKELLKEAGGQFNDIPKVNSEFFQGITGMHKIVAHYVRTNLNAV